MNVLKNIKRVCIGARFFSQEISTISPIEMASKTYWNNTVVNNKNAAAPIVIMHGLFGSKQNWRSFSKAMLGQTIPPRRVCVYFYYY